MASKRYKKLPEKTKDLNAEFIEKLLPELKKNKGAIVNIGSKVSVTGQGGTSGYAAACGGRNTLTREWAVELIPYSIRVNSVIVAECYTPLYKKWVELNQNKRIESKESAFHLSVVIDLKTLIAEYFESSNLAISWQNTSEEDRNGICSILLMDFLIELAHTFHSKFRTT